MEMLIIAIQRILYKMPQIGHPAWDLHEVRRLAAGMRENRQIIRES